MFECSLAHAKRIGRRYGLTPTHECQDSVTYERNGRFLRISDLKTNLQIDEGPLNDSGEKTFSRIENTPLSVQGWNSSATQFSRREIDFKFRRFTGNEPTRSYHKRLLRSVILRALHPGYGCCGRCRTPWPECESHTTIVNFGHGMFPLCVDCWSELTPNQRLPYYKSMCDTWTDHNDKWEEIQSTVLAGG